MAPNYRQNPLAGIPKSQLLEDVSRFATDFKLADHVSTLQKGALVAQRPHGFVSILELDERDREQPKALYFTIIMTSIGAAVQGWDKTGSNGANLIFPQAFGILSTGPVCKAAGNCYKNSWITGFVNACPYIAIATISSWASDPVNNLLGRRGALFVAGIISLLAPIGACRLILGIGMGLKEVAAPVFSAENSPASIRGGLVMSWQMWSSAFLPAIPLVVGIYFCPESPRWLMKKENYVEAYKSLLRLRNTPLQAARYLYYAHVQLVEEESLKKSSRKYGMAGRFVELFTVPRIRRATVASGVVMLAQQMCGINIMSFYSSNIFTAAGATPIIALVASFGYSLVTFVFSWPAVWTIDKFGRRTLLLFPLSHREIGMAWAVAVNNVFATQVSLTFTTMVNTKQRTLEELDHVFGVPTRRHISYQVRTVLPWWLRRWVLFREGEIYPDLHEVADISTSPDVLSSSDKEGAIVEVKV
ncbi:hypothetical protein OIDMADRAFT_42746 [Oidiodendron maius Zn]|uniref:Major facilitator superfamily (MFS) profile domain-containing protein n=1 Tax=Oidiodendron maius (strain Zn) TaxID=913774 RepID=A0A0C3GUJ1_OIDMZ|nr:hypothetical protein OIDMADRAFT_42746 [Oidiodendron maius Zn]